MHRAVTICLIHKISLNKFIVIIYAERCNLLLADEIRGMFDVDFKIYRKIMDNKSVRRNVALPNWLNREAEQAHINVSKVLQKALMEVLGLNKL